MFYVLGPLESETIVAIRDTICRPASSSFLRRSFSNRSSERSDTHVRSNRVTSSSFVLVDSHSLGSSR